MRNLTKAFVAASLAAVAAAPASAQSINFVGTTSFCFTGAGGGTPACPTYGTPATLGPLSFVAGGFNVTTLDGMAAIGGQGQNLGVATLAGGSNFTFTGNTFGLRVIFSAPAGTGNSTFSSTLMGSVNSTNAGGVNVTFTPATFSGAFGGSPSGTYTLSVNNFSLTPGQTNVEITGSIMAATVPEPSTYALMGAGLLALGGVVRRRRTV